MYCSSPAKSASGSFRVNPCVPPPAVGHHSRGCESGVNTMTRRLGSAVCASSSRCRKNGDKNTAPAALLSRFLREKKFRFDVTRILADQARGQTGQVCLWGDFSELSSCVERQFRTESTRCRPRRFILWRSPARADRDLVFQDSHLSSGGPPPAPR